MDGPRQALGIAWPEFAMLDGGFEKQADLLAGNPGVFENVLVKLWVG
jgi:hypothetical protein